jgi:hypothetical protein
MQAFDIPGGASYKYPTQPLLYGCVRVCVCACVQDKPSPGTHIPGNPAPTRVGRPDLRVASPPPSRLGTCSNTTDIPFRCWNPVLSFLLSARRASYLCWCRPRAMGKREGLRDAAEVLGRLLLSPEATASLPLIALSSAHVPSRLLIENQARSRGQGQIQARWRDRIPTRETAGV